MRCKNCPAYWESRDYYYGVEDWGCYCDPDNKYAQYEFANGDCGCHRKKEYIKKIMAGVHYDKTLHYVLDSIDGIIELHKTYGLKFENGNENPHTFLLELRLNGLSKDLESLRGIRREIVTKYMGKRWRG